MYISFYLCIKNCHKLTASSNPQFIVMCLTWHNWFLCSGFYKAIIKVSLGLHSHQEWLDGGRIHFQGHSGCWQHLFSCDHMPKVPTFHGHHLLGAQSSLLPSLPWLLHYPHKWSFLLHRTSSLSFEGFHLNKSVPPSCNLNNFPANWSTPTDLGR